MQHKRKLSLVWDAYMYMEYADYGSELSTYRSLVASLIQHAKASSHVSPEQHSHTTR